MHAVQNDLADLWADPAVPVVLRSTLTSPFGRKVRMALHELGLNGRVEVITANPLDPEDTLLRQNPLGKMPCLLIGGEAFHDSHVILELLESLAGRGALFPAAGLARFRALTRARLADGITEAALLITYEDRFRTPDQRAERWLEHQRQKIRRGLAALAAEPPDPGRVDGVSITLAACLGYLDWRRPLDWRAEYPRLADWLAQFAAAHPVWAATQDPRT